MGKMVTGGDANALAGSQIFPFSDKCLTYSELISNGFAVSQVLDSNRLVDSTYVSSPGASYDVYTMNAAITVTQGVSQQYAGRMHTFIVDVMPDNMSDFPSYRISRLQKSFTYSAPYGGDQPRSTTFTLEFPMNSNTQFVTIRIWIGQTSNIFRYSTTADIGGTSAQQMTPVTFNSQTVLEKSYSDVIAYTQSGTNPFTFNCRIHVVERPSTSRAYSLGSQQEDAYSKLLKQDIDEILSK